MQGGHFLFQPLLISSIPMPPSMANIAKEMSWSVPVTPEPSFPYRLLSVQRNVQRHPAIPGSTQIAIVMLVNRIDARLLPRHYKCSAFSTRQPWDSACTLRTDKMPGMSCSMTARCCMGAVSAASSEHAAVPLQEFRNGIWSHELKTEELSEYTGNEYGKKKDKPRIRFPAPQRSLSQCPVSPRLIECPIECSMSHRVHPLSHPEPCCCARSALG